MAARFRDRFEAGRVLARLLKRHTNDPDALVLALPRGGVPVGYEVARELESPLDVFVVRKLGLRDDTRNSPSGPSPAAACED